MIGKPAFSEPELVPCPLLDGCEIEVTSDFMRLAGWVEIQPQNPDEPAERRIVMRAALPTALVRALMAEAKKALSRGGH